MADARLVPCDEGQGVLVPPALVARVYGVIAREARQLYARDRVRLAADELQLLGTLQDAAAANAVRSARGSDCGTTDGPAEVDGAGWLSCMETAQLLGKSPRWVGSLIHRGDLPGSTKKAGVWMVPAASVDQYLATRHRRRGIHAA